MKRMYLLFILTLLISSIRGQKYETDMLYSLPLSFNPAFTGYSTGARLIVQHGFEHEEGSENRFSHFSFDNSYGKGIGVGLRLSSELHNSYFWEADRYDNAGLLLSKILVQKDVFTLSVGGEINYFISDQPYAVGPVFRERGSEKSEGIDGAAGFFFAYKQLLGGLSVTHLAEPDIAYVGYEGNRLPRLLRAHLTYQAINDERFRFAPDAVFMTEKEYMDLLLGFHITYSKMQFGYRFSFLEWLDYFALFTGYQGKRWAVKLSYRINEAYYGQSNSSELNLSYYFKSNKKREDLPWKLPLSAF